MLDDRRPYSPAIIPLDADAPLSSRDRLEYSGLAIIQPLAMGTDAIASLLLYDKYSYTQQHIHSSHRQPSTDTPTIHQYYQPDTS